MRGVFLMLLTALLSLATGAGAWGQNYLDARYAPGTGRPVQLNVCGDADGVVYEVALRAGSPQARGVQVTVELFEGVRAITFDAANSSAGVSLVSLADPTRPVVALPNLRPGNSSARLAFRLQARCETLDTLSANPTVEVRDRLRITYTDIAGNPATEVEAIDEYRDPITFPVFSVGTTLASTPLRIGQRVTRTIELANGSFRGYADTLTYTLAQGAGASVEAIRVNGTARAFAKAVDGAGDTTVTLLLAGADFAGNLGAFGVGNGDTRFDPSERLFIEEDLYVSDCRATRVATHAALYGCDGAACRRSAVDSDLPVGIGQPNLLVTRAGGTFPNAEVGYCQTGDYTIRVENVGSESDAGFGAAHDVAMGNVIDGALRAGGYAVTRVAIAGVDVADLQPTVRLDTLAAFTVDPDGPGGLDDLDGDGYFDDLAVGESYLVDVSFELECSALSTYDRDESCANDATTTFQAQTYWSDGCGATQTAGDGNLYAPLNLQDDFEQRTEPDAIADGTPFRIELEFGRLVFDFANGCSADAELRAYVKLPAGVTVDAGASRLDRGGAPPMPLLGVTYSNDTATLRFDPSGEAFLNGTYTLSLGLTADCTAPNGETLFPTTVAYYCPTCTCEHVWICEDVIGPWIHKVVPPCALADLYPCPQGVQGTSFAIERTTLGFTDAGFSSPIAPASANRQVAIPADSVEIRVTGLVGDATVTDSLGLVLYYLTMNEEVDTAGLFLLGGGELGWHDGTAWRSCPVPATAFRLETDARETFQRFDLGACLAANGWALAPGDSIRFTGAFEINPLGPVTTTYEFVEDLRGGFYAVDGGVETDCDQIGDVFRIGSPYTVFGAPTNNSFPKGCAPAALDFRLTGVNRGYFDEFGAEFRRAARLDSLVISFDTAAVGAFDDIYAEVFVANHPTQGNSFYAVGGLVDLARGRYVLRLDTLDHAADLHTTYPYLYNFRLHLTPKCSSVRGSSRGDNNYALRAEPFYADRNYASDIGDGSRVELVEEDVALNVNYSDPVTLDLQLLSAPTQRIAGDSADVELIVCNTSTRSAAGRTWLSFNDTSALRVAYAELIDDRASPVRLAVETFTGGHYLDLEGVATNSAVNTNAQICNTVRLRVGVGDCGSNVMRYAAGWSCDAVTPVGWTPAQDEACVDDRALARIESISPFLEADLIAEPGGAVDLCAETTLEFQVNNAQAGTAFAILSQYYVPEGMRYVPGSAEVAYPPSQAFQPTAAEPVDTSGDVRGAGLAFPDLAAVHPYLGAEGLQGFDAGAPTDSSRYLLRLRFASDCDYRSGSVVYFEAQGEEACGQRTNFSATESSAIQINGAEPDGTHRFALTFDAPATLSAAPATSTLVVAIEHTGTDPSDADDLLEVTLPAGLDYVDGTASPMAPATWVPGEPDTTDLNGVTKLSWSLPVGLAPGETARLSLGVRADAYACGDVAQLALTAVRLVGATCVSDGSTCSIPSDVTEGGTQFETLPVGEPVTARERVSTSVCDGDSTELVTLEVEVGGSGLAFTGADATLALYRDSNADGVAGPGDILLNQQTIATQAGDTSLVYRFGGSLPRATLGSLVLFADSTGLGLCAPESFPLGLPRLLNAGASPLTVCVSERPTLAMGDSVCTASTGLSFAWRSVPAGYEGYLDDAFVAAPRITFPDPYLGPGDLQYILETTRAGLGSTEDTVNLAVSQGVLLGETPDETIDFGERIVLTPDVQRGRAPISYRWSPAASLSDPTDAQPIASPRSTQVYDLVVTDGLGCSGTTTQLVTVRNPIVASVSVADTTICPFDSLRLVVGGGSEVRWEALPANPTTGGLTDSTRAGVSFTADGAVGAYAYRAIVTDPAYPGYADTVGVTVTSSVVGCVTEFVWRDTVVVGGDRRLCLDNAALALAAGPLTVRETCADAAGEAVVFRVDTAAACVDYSGYELGEERSCLEVCDIRGRCTLGTLIVTVVEGNKRFVYDRIYINQTERLCVDSSALVRARLFRTADALVELSTSASGACFDYRGRELGQDTVGVELLRADGTRDTVCLVVEVVPYVGGSTGRPDSVCTVRNTPVQVNVLANDDVYGGVASFRIVDGPSEGTVVVNPDNTVTYTPPEDVCARDLTFVYEVCNPNPGGCAQTRVTVCVTCEALEVFTAISPNRDGVNDVLYVAKIEEFPNNELRVFNRWGTLVYRAEGYRNNWGGTYNGDPLPDGAYFYILEVRDAGERSTYRGYVEIVR